MSIFMPYETIASAKNQSKPNVGSIWLLWGTITAVVALLIINACRYPPFNDFGEWIYQAYVAKYLLTHDLTFAMLKKWPVPNSISELIMAALMVVFSPLAAARLFLSSYVVCGSLLAIKLSRIYGGRYRGALFVLLMGLMVLPTPLWTGETNYQVGLLFLCAYMFWISQREQSFLKSLFTDAAFGVLIFFSHAICLLIFVVFILLKALQKGTLILTCVSLIPAGLLSLIYLHFYSRHENTEAELSIALHGVLGFIAYRIYMFSKLGPYANMILGSSGDFERARLIYCAGVGLNLIFCATLIVLVSKWLWTRLGTNWRSPEVLTSVVCVAIYLWNPTKVLHVATIGERFLLPAILAAVLGGPATSKLRRIAALASGSLCIFMIYWLLILPQAPLSVGIFNDAISDPGKRFELLYWHRPFLFSQSAESAEEANRTSRPPVERLGFSTSLLSEKE
jgi:hypothetical protein